MKKLIAIATIVASAQASAFWGWDDSNSSSNARHSGNTDVAGNASAEVETAFAFDFTGRIRSKGMFQGNGTQDGKLVGYGYDAPYYSPYAQYPTAR